MCAQYAAAAVIPQGVEKQLNDELQAALEPPRPPPAVLCARRASTSSSGGPPGTGT